MENWQYVLILKPLAVLVVAGVYYVCVYRGSHYLGRFIPQGRVTDFLFRERGRHDAGRPAHPGNQASHGLDDLAPLSRRKGR